MLKQACDMQQRRFAGSRWCDQRHRLATPHGKLRALENVERSLALTKVTADAVQEDQRFLVVFGGGWRNLGYGRGIVHQSITRSEALRPDRGARPATTDRALPEATDRAPSPRQRWS